MPLNALQIARTPPERRCDERPWTSTCVATLNMLNVSGASLSHMAYTLGRSEPAICGALWVLARHTLADALEELNPLQMDVQKVAA